MICRLCGGVDRTILPYRYCWQKNEYRLSRCRICSLISVDPLPDAAQIASFYDQDYFENGLHGLDDVGMSYLERTAANSAHTLRFVEESILAHKRDASSLFEIGAATGHLLDCAKKAGLERVSGIEISDHAAAVASNRYGIDLHVGDVGTFDTDPHAGRWDIVYAGDVLEHVPDPAGLLEVIATILAPDGVAVVRIPTTFDLLSSRIATVALNLSGRVLTLPDAPYHLHEFTRRTAQRLFEDRFGDVRLMSGIVPVGSLNTKGGRALYRIKQAVHILNVPLTGWTGRFGDRLTVIARKPRVRGLRL